METPKGGRQRVSPSDGSSSFQTENRYEDDTISLIDLVAVVVRYRTMIVIGTILTCIVTAMGLYLTPLVGLEIDQQSGYTAQRQMLVENFPQRIRQYIDFDPAVRLQSILNDPTFVAEVYAPFEENVPTDRTPERYLATVRRHIIGNAYRVEWNSGTRLLTLRYTASTPDSATGFIEAIASRGVLELGTQMGPQLEDARDALSRMIDENEIQLAGLIRQAIQETPDISQELSIDSIIEYLEISGNNVLSVFASVTGDMVVLEEAIEESHQLVTFFGPPVVFEVFEEDSRSPITVVVVATILAFFILVFLAFVFEYVRRVRQDPDEMHKLRSAWHQKDE